jgi:signal transduction histidine kinase
VLGHDLRNPLAAIGAGADALRREPLGDRAASVVDLIQKSVGRMAGLIDHVLDFARARLGGGLELGRAAAEPLEPALEQVVAELRASWPDRSIETRFALGGAVRCDRGRVAQLLSNLLANALVHGGPGGPIRVEAAIQEGTFELSVANPGDPIPPATLDRLFQPFFRAAARRGQQGLGLGLYIASEIARAHDGAVDVVSTPAETRFTFRMPAG